MIKTFTSPMSVILSNIFWNMEWNNSGWHHFGGREKINNAWFCEPPPSVVVVHGGADKALARPTSRCRRTESIVSLERGVCSCAELQVFSCYRGWKEPCHATSAISTTSRRELSSSYFSLQGKAPKEIHAILKQTLGERAPSYTTMFKLGGPV